MLWPDVLNMRHIYWRPILGENTGIFSVCSICDNWFLPTRWHTIEGVYPSSLHLPPSVQAKALQQFAARNTISSTLDPLLLVLSRDYVDDNDLTARLQKLFKACHDPYLVLLCILWPSGSSNDGFILWLRWVAWVMAKLRLQNASRQLSCWCMEPGYKKNVLSKFPPIADPWNVHHPIRCIPVIQSSYCQNRKGYCW